jgi:RNA ligase (TIGR02306 family)
MNLVNMERKLASIQIVKDVRPIVGADAIEVVRINNWDVVSKKGEYKVGDFCIYCEIDSFLPIKEEFEFLRKTSYKKMSDGSEGFRLRTIRMRNQLSQGLLLPISILEGPDEMKIGISEQPWGNQLQLGPYDNALVIKEGVDVTEMLGIVKYEPPIPAELQGKVKGMFPSFIRKTDEERIQNLSSEYENIRLSNKGFYVTEKLDGSSATFYYKDGVFGVCSRNLELLETEGNSFWKVARELNLEKKLKSLGKNICIQGELLGPGVNGNIYKLNKHTLRIFNIYDIDLCKHYTLDVFINTIQNLKLQEIPILDSNFDLPKTIDELLFIADGKSKLNGNIDREGLVIRSVDRKISFKVISNKFLLKYE